jgi:hypothetical protein
MKVSLRSRSSSTDVPVQPATEAAIERRGAFASHPFAVAESLHAALELDLPARRPLELRDERLQMDELAFDLFFGCQVPLTAPELLNLFEVYEFRFADCVHGLSSLRGSVACRIIPLAARKLGTICSETPNPEFICETVL